MTEFQFKEHYDVNDLVAIVKILRSPNGCPWDKVQTHETIRSDFIEEVYEAVEAIDEQNTEHLREELGDVLLQVVFHTVLETEKGHFVLDDVADDVCQKMILRHPHVFGNVTADTPEEVLQNWDRIKMQSKSQRSAGEAMDSVSKTLPSLMRSQKLHKKAQRGGLPPKSVEEQLEQLTETLTKLKNSLADTSKETIDQSIGRILFQVAGLAEELHVDSEKSLYFACDRFTEHFKKLEETAKLSGVDIQNTAQKLTDELLEKEKENEYGGS